MFFYETLEEARANRKTGEVTNLELDCLHLGKIRIRTARAVKRTARAVKYSTSFMVTTTKEK
jgi:hypothetical protein